jgi:hypothetical protein
MRVFTNIDINYCGNCGKKRRMPKLPPLPPLPPLFIERNVDMSDNERLGDAPIEEQYHAQMNALAQAVDEFLNPQLPGLPTGKGKKNGFIIMVFPFEGHKGRCNYISNARREDVVVMLKEQLARFQGQPEIVGRA